VRSIFFRKGLPKKVKEELQLMPPFGAITQQLAVLEKELQLANRRKNAQIAAEIS
jgi:hypothetical protein